MYQEIESYKEKGWSYIPLQYKSKMPAMTSWYRYMECKPTDTETKLWFSENNRNVGVVTGKISRLIVLDFDTIDAHALWYSKNTLTPTAVCRTAHGYHIYITCNEPGAMVTFKLGDRVNHFKADGGYVVAPPSIHPDGPHYKFYTFLRGNVQPYSREEIIESVQNAGGVFTAIERPERPANWASELFVTTGTGERNTRAAQLCGLLINKFPYDPGLIMGIMEAWNNTHCSPPLSTQELTTLVDGEFRRYGPRT